MGEQLSRTTGAPETQAFDTAFATLARHPGTPAGDTRSNGTLLLRSVTLPHATSSRRRPSSLQVVLDVLAVPAVPDAGGRSPLEDAGDAGDVNRVGLCTLEFLALPRWLPEVCPHTLKCGAEESGGHNDAGREERQR